MGRVRRVEVENGTHYAFIGVGTNLGDREKNVEEALSKIKEQGIVILQRSSIIETEPYGLKKQPKFLNCVIEIETKLSPHDLLKTLLAIEQTMGRVRKIHWGPRIIDLDILFYNSEITSEKNLKIPHPDIQNRLFVLKPLSEIAPNFVHPVLKKSIKEIFRNFREKETL